jgi:hypothetical protein
MSALARVACTGLLALTLACDEGVDDYKPEPNVHCILQTGRDTISLMAGMTLGYYDSIPDPDRWNGVAGVVATVTSRDSQTVLAELPGPVGFYRAEPFAIVPGDTYSLLATYPGGVVVNGSTVVPDTFSLYSLRCDTILYTPWPGDTMRMLQVSLAWSESRGAAAYLAESWAWYQAGPDSTMLPGLYAAGGRYETLTVQPFSYEWDTLTQTLDSFPLDRVRIAVRAADRNYYDYRRLGWWMGGAELMYLDGGIGVFGSACIAETTITFAPAR